MLNVKINTHGNPLPTKNGEWYDLATPKQVMCHAGEFMIIDFMISVKAPEGYHPVLASRSSTPLKWGLIIANGFGLIEHNYCGDNDHLGLVAYATRDVIIPAGTRLAQFTIVRQSEPIDFEQVETMGESDRGGYGSTGL